MKIGYRTDFYEKYGGGSAFYGTVGGNFAKYVLSFIIILFTLGLGTPWVICMWYRWRMNNLIVDGKEIVFEGKGCGLFWRCLLWIVYTIFTLGIFGLWYPIKIREWLAENTHFVVNEAEPYPAAFCRKSVFCGGVLDHIRLRFKQTLFLVLTLGIATPWVICMGRRWRLNNMIIDGKQLVFEGRGKDLFDDYITDFWLTVVTLGIYGFWVNVRTIKWQATYTHFE